MFCQKCGAQLADGSSFCVSCGAQQVPQQAAPQQAAPQQAAAPTFAQYNGNTAPSAFGIYIKKVLGNFLGIFSNPSDTLNNAASEKAPIWLTFFGALLILGWSSIMALVQGVGVWYTEELGMMGEDGVSFGLVLLFSMIVIVVPFFLKAAITWLLATQGARINAPFTAVLNMVAVAEIPMIVALFLASFTCFIWYPLALVFLIIGAAMSTGLYSEAVKATGVFGEKSAWLTMIANVVTTLASVLLIYWALYAWTEETGLAAYLIAKFFEYN